MSKQHYDVAIIGGGPAGSTAGTLLKKYNPDLRVVIFEREKFPREHVGESQLPPISDILDEMGCWDKVEAANFPIKIGATYRWGSSPKLWDFEFMPVSEFEEEPRPAKYEGQRRRTAFQVDRAVYDDILLRHAEEAGCEVHEETKVVEISRDGNMVTGIGLHNGEVVTADYYIDASGGVGILRRAMGVEIDEPTKLKNIAIWDYWENAEWAVEIGVGATRVQVLSLGYGWMWFIPLGPTRTSIGLICPAEFYKKCGKKPEALYLQAVSEEPRVSALTAGATREGLVRTTKDWSFLAERMAGGNWFLAGESCGFADPILAAGLTLAHSGAREVAYTILELDRGEHDADWLKQRYEEAQSKRIRQHIQFADYWYSANGQFTDLQEYTAEIAKEAGLNLAPEKAFQWLGTGGFTNDILGQVGVGGLDVAGVKQIMQLFADKEAEWKVSSYNVFRLNIDGATQEFIPVLIDGRIERMPCYARNGKVLPEAGVFKLIIDTLREHRDAGSIYNAIVTRTRSSTALATQELLVRQAMQVLEVMVVEGWVRAKLDPNKPRLTVSTPTESAVIHENRDSAPT